MPKNPVAIAAVVLSATAVACAAPPHRAAAPPAPPAATAPSTTRKDAPLVRPPRTVVAAVRTVAVGATARALPRATETTTTQWVDTSPPDPGCTSESHGTDVVFPGGTGGVGTGAGYQDCFYVASRPGGYSGRGTWTITIHRNGEDITLDSGHDPSCGPTGTIRPGDEVKAWPSQNGVSSADARIAVGDAAHC